MIELLGGLAALLGVLLIIAVVYAVTYRRERDDYRDVHETNSKFQAGTIEILNNRVTVLRMDVEERDKTIAELRKVNTDLYRENGRLKAEAVAEKMSEPVPLPPNTIVQAVLRDPETGRFLPKKPKPVSCG